MQCIGEKEGGGGKALQQMPATETSKSTSLSHLQQMYNKDGSSLPVAEHLRGSRKLQSFPAVPGMCVPVMTCQFAALDPSAAWLCGGAEFNQC